MSILQQVPNEPKIKTVLKEIVFGERKFCPHCGSYNIRKYNSRYRCKRCRKPFSLTSPTWLKSMKLSLQELWLLTWCWCREIPVDQTTKLTGKSEVTVRRWYDKFRKHLPQDVRLRLRDVVQMDEAYYGGKNGCLIIAAKQQGTRKAIAQTLPQTNPQRHHVVPLLQQYVTPGSCLQTDGHSIYQGIDNWWPLQHRRDIHSKFEFALTSEVEGLFGNLKTFIRRMYHHSTKDKLPGYVEEFLARFCHSEYFKNPQSFLKASLTSLDREAIVEARSHEKETPSFSQEIPLQSPAVTNKTSLPVFHLV